MPLNPLRSLTASLIFWFCLIGTSGGYCLWQLSNGNPFYSNITELLPRDKTTSHQQFTAQRLQNKLQDKLLILIRQKSDTNLNAAHSLREAISASSYTTGLENHSNLQQDIINFYQPFQDQLLPEQLRQKLLSHSADVLADEVLAKLFAPVQEPSNLSFSQDPFALSSAWQKHINKLPAAQLEQGIPVVQYQDEYWYLIHCQINGSPFDLSLQESITELIENNTRTVAQQDLLLSGLIIHAAAGADISRQEISTVGLGSLLGIILLTLIAFRSALPLVAVAITLFSGSIVALACSLLVFGKIHLLTLAFGTTLLGIAVDYSYHLIIKSQTLGNSYRARNRLGRALSIGALTSVSAFLLQFTSPLPGLQQIAVFCSAGLFGTWATIILLGPLYPAKKSATPALFDRQLRHRYQQLLAKPILTISLLALTTASAVVIIAKQGSNDQLSILNTSSQQLLAMESRVQKILTTTSSSHFIEIHADSMDGLLHKTEKLQQQLIKQELISGSTALSTFIPPIAQQRADYELVHRQLYGDKGALKIICRKLSIDCSNFSSLANKKFTPLLASQYKESPLAELWPIGLEVNGDRYRTTLLLKAPLKPTELTRLSLQDNDIQHIDQVSLLSDLLSQSRSAISQVLCLTLVILSMALFYRYRLGAMRVLLPISISIVISLAISGLGQGITLFHLLALLLVLGLGIDTAIIYLETGLNNESWFAASLSSATSVLAFGLLSLSQVPILHFFGSIILSGIIILWLLTPLFFININNKLHENSTYE